MAERLDPTARLRLILQERAPKVLRLHVRRAALRVAVLVVADLGVFAVMRELFGVIQDGEWLGRMVSTALRAVFPAYLGGWQYAAALILALFLTGNYGAGDRRRDPSRLLAGCALATALPLWSLAWGRGFELVALEFVLTACVVWLALLTERLSVDVAVARVMPRRTGLARTLLVGCAADCRATRNLPALKHGRGFTVLGFVDVTRPASEDALGHLDDLAEYISRHRVDTVVICAVHGAETIRRVADVAIAGGCQLLSVPQSFGLTGLQPDLVWRRGQPFISLSAPSLRGQQLVVKRVLDVFGALFGLVVLAPFALVVWLAIRLDSGGHTLFGHRRLGLNGEPFRCLKWRSMFPDAEGQLRSDSALYAEYVSSNFKLSSERDPRLTRVGRFLRKWSLDEFPQLINVLRGQMSLVGPRPIVPEELDHYGPEAALFLSLKPGMTGAWAVNGRSGVAYPDRTDLELDYVRNWSLALDLSILIRTLPAVLRRRGAH